jgi:hypothetical protein
MFECRVNGIKTREVSLVNQMPLSKTRGYIEKKLCGFPRHYIVDKALRTQCDVRSNLCAFLCVRCG